MPSWHRWGGFFHVTIAVGFHVAIPQSDKGTTIFLRSLVGWLAVEPNKCNNTYS